jgi:hypothetical protein
VRVVWLMGYLPAPSWSHTHAGRKPISIFLSHEQGRVIWSFFKKLTRFVALTKRLLTASHGSGIGGCKILKQCYEREMNFYRGKSRICITLRGAHKGFSLLSVDYGRFRISSSGTSQGAHRRCFLALMVDAPGSTALAPHRGPAVDVCYFDGGRSQNSVSIPRGPEGPPSTFVMLMVDAPRSPSALTWGPAVGVS